MKTTAYRVIAAILTMTMILSFAACSQPSGTVDANTGKSVSQPSTKTPQPTSDQSNINVESSQAQIQLSVRRFDSTSPQAWSASFHVIRSAKGNILIDPGKYDDELAAYVKSIGGLDAILITHGHWDKLTGLDGAKKANPNATVYIHKLDQPYLLDPVLNCSAEDGFSGVTETATSTFVEGTYKFGGYTVEVIHTPGHTRGSSLFYFKNENMLFGGDTIMADLVGSSKHPSGSTENRAASIEKFKRLVFPNDMKIYCGHGADTTYADLFKTNVDLK